MENVNRKDNVCTAYTGIIMKLECECFSPMEICFTAIEAEKVILLASVAETVTKEAAPDGMKLAFEISSPMPEVIRVKTECRREGEKVPAIESRPKDKESFMEVIDSKEKITITSEGLRLEILKAHTQMIYYGGEEKLTESDEHGLARVKTYPKAFAVSEEREQSIAMRQHFTIGVGELLYGMGERFTPFVINGQSIEVLRGTEDGSEGCPYNSVPFYVSSKGYGILVNYTGKAEFEFASRTAGRAGFLVPGESFEYFLFYASSIKEVLMRYAVISGKPQLPAPWAFGLHVSDSFVKRHGEESAKSFTEAMKKHGILPEAAHMDAEQVQYIQCEKGACRTDYESMEECLRRAVSLSMSGFGYQGQVIGRYEKSFALDVFKRWCAFGLLSPHSGLYSENPDGLSLEADEEVVLVLRHFVKLKASLMPYLYRNAVETSKTGVPMMRSMVLEYTADKNCAYLDKQYMLGDSILAAPILNEDGIGEYYLPDGTWTHLLSGERRMGSRWHREAYDYFSLPLFVKPGSLIAVGKEEAFAYDYADGVVLKAYELIDNVPAETIVYNEEAEVQVRARVLKLNDEIRISVKSTRPYQVVLVNAVNVKEVENCRVKICGNDTVVTPVGMGTMLCRGIS